MDRIPRTPDNQECARQSCHHPFAAHELDEDDGSELRCAACGCSKFAYLEDFPEDIVSTPQEINYARKKNDHAERETPPAQARAPGA